MVAYTWTFVVLSVPLGTLGARKSEAAMSAAMAKATVVKNPKVFCTLTKEVYMVGRPRATRAEGSGGVGCCGREAGSLESRVYGYLSIASHVVH